MSGPIALKRVYQSPLPEDGLRVLVERLWPRGLSKERAKVGLWLKELGPSTELRKWFGHDPARWDEFRQRYRAELRGKRDAVQSLRQKAKEGKVTLVYAAHDQEHNGALVLRQLLGGRNSRATTTGATSSVKGAEPESHPKPIRGKPCIIINISSSAEE